MNCSLRVELAETGATLAADIARIDELWSEGLNRFGGPYLAAPRPTAVDAFFAPVASRVNTYGLELGPAALGYGTRLIEHPAMREWYAAALEESWRLEDHEAEARASGRVIEDRRLREGA